MNQLDLSTPQTVDLGVDTPIVAGAAKSSDHDCLLTLSGGIDSVVLAHYLVAQGRNPLCVYVDYGSVSKPAELRASRATAKRLGLDLVELPMLMMKDIANAFILGNTTEYADGAQFWLEGRNGLLGMILAIMASYRGLTDVYMGINHSDSRGDYLDTTPAFLGSLNLLLMHSFHNKVTVSAPWVEFEFAKRDVINHGLNYDIDWVAETHSCSSGEHTACCAYWKCESCESRRADFESLGLADPFTPIKG